MTRDHFILVKKTNLAFLKNNLENNIGWVNLDSFNPIPIGLFLSNIEGGGGRVISLL